MNRNFWLCALAFSAVSTVAQADNLVSELRGHCSDFTRTQFSAARDFAESMEGLELNSQDSAAWAARYNDTHDCGTIAEYSLRYRKLSQVASSIDGLNLNLKESQAYALERAEQMDLRRIERMSAVLKGVREFAYSVGGLNLTSNKAGIIARRWVDRGNCGDEGTVRRLREVYLAEYQDAYSPDDSSLTATQARKVAARSPHIAKITPCQDLLLQQL